MKKILLVFLAVMLAACGRSGSDYVGKWHASDGKHFVEISKNGDNFLLKITEPAYKGLFVNDPGKSTTTTMSGTVKDGLMKIDGPFGGWTATYVKDNDTLLFPNPAGGSVPYQRDK